jgi:hypothetical protein
LSRAATHLDSVAAIALHTVRAASFSKAWPSFSGSMSDSVECAGERPLHAVEATELRAR